MRMPHLLLGTMLLGAGLTGCQEAAAPAGDRQAAASQLASASTPAWELLADQAYEVRVRRLIAGARSGVDLVMFSVVLPDDAGATHPVRLMLETVIERHRAGIPVRVVLDQGAPPGRERPSAHAFRVLAEAGVAVRWDEDERTTHIKALVVDRRWCVLGSHNWTFSALRRNREQSLLVDDPVLAARLGGEFTRLWDGLAVEAPRRKR